jgi:hypothetical protein
MVSVLGAPCAVPPHNGNSNMVLRDIGFCRLDWILLAHDSDQWQALVNV